jgi:hypothetical protein
MLAARFEPRCSVIGTALQHRRLLDASSMDLLERKACPVSSHARWMTPWRIADACFRSALCVHMAPRSACRLASMCTSTSRVTTCPTTTWRPRVAMAGRCQGLLGTRSGQPIPRWTSCASWARGSSALLLYPGTEDLERHTWPGRVPETTGVRERDAGSSAQSSHQRHQTSMLPREAKSVPCDVTPFEKENCHSNMLHHTSVMTCAGTTVRHASVATARSASGQHRRGLDEQRVTAGPAACTVRRPPAALPRTSAPH